MKSTKFILLGGVALIGLALLFSRQSGPPKVAYFPTQNKAAQSLRPVQTNVMIPVVRNRLREALDDATKPFPERHKVLLSLGKKLSRQECDELAAALKRPLEPSGFDIQAAIKNDIMDALEAQANLAEPWPRLLAALFQDKSQDPVTRDYALQHLFQWCETTKVTGKSDTLRSEVTAVLWGALEETPLTIRATALLGLQYLTETDPGTDRERIRKSALQLASDGSADENARLTALQVCSRMNFEPVLPVARGLTGAETKLPLRLSAIAALGRMGGKEDLQLLEGLGPDQEIKPALMEAIRQVKNRIKG
jgi:hypothetical protein